MNKLSLSLYHYESCPFCRAVRNSISELGVDVEYRNTHKELGHFNKLNEQGGKTQVPCLLIEETNGNKEWLYESKQIIEYLNTNSIEH